MSGWGRRPIRGWGRRLDERIEADKAARSTEVACAGCGRTMRHRGLYCASCRRNNQ